MNPEECKLCKWSHTELKEKYIFRRDLEGHVLCSKGTSDTIECRYEGKDIECSIYNGRVHCLAFEQSNKNQGGIRNVAD